MLRHFKSDNFDILLWCTSLSIIFFLADLTIRWAVVGILYVFVILLALKSTKDKHAYLFAVITSTLLIVNLVLFPPLAQAWRVLTNHLLVVILIWVTAISGLRYRKAHLIKSELAAIVDSSDDAIVGKTFANVVTSWNKGAEHVFGYTAEEMIGKSITPLIPEERQKDELTLLDKVQKGKKVTYYETIRIRKDGHLISISLALSPVRDPFGTIIGISSISRDITKRIRAERRVRELNERVALEKTKLEEVLSIEEHLNAIFDINKLIDFVVEKTTKILEAEKCSLMLLDANTKELCIKGAKGLDDVLIAESRVRLGDPIAGLIAQDGKPVLVTDIEKDHRFTRKNKPAYKSKSFISAPIELGGTVMGVVSVADKTSKEGTAFSELDLKILCMIVRQVAIAIENTKLYRELKHLTITDPLTQIFNYRHFTTTLDREIKRMRRFGRPLSLLMIDIDDFKSYNDSFGHLEGDILLKEVSKALNTSIREVDIACRYAGDEFVVILPETDVNQAQLVVAKIKKKIAELSLKRLVTVSIGVAQCAANMDRYALIMKADALLYETKKQSKQKQNV